MSESENVLKSKMSFRARSAAAWSNETRLTRSSARRWSMKANRPLWMRSRPPACAIEPEQSIARVSASTTTKRRTCFRVEPTERSMPISRVRLSTETARVLASPSRPAAAATTRMT